MKEKITHWSQFQIHDAWMSASENGKDFHVVNWRDIGLRGHAKFIKYKIEDYGMELILTREEALEAKRQRQKEKDKEYRDWCAIRGIDP